jgi:hypothetical protein
MDMKKAFDDYFKRLNKLWHDKTGFLPQVPFDEKLSDYELYINGTLNQYSKGYVAWQPKLQTKPIDFTSVEKEIDCAIHSSIKDFYSAYWFIDLNIEIENVPEFNTHNIDLTSNEVPSNEFWLEKITPDIDVLQKMKTAISIGKIDELLFTGRKFIYIGNGSVNGDDSFTLLADIIVD